ncbi:endonuclease domain-containing protein [Mycobacterium sp. SMC-4]|uniref:endonuclease domain-containing protein n=1 Tax=Mycobacterium sp. SMC-4 TaxID=2857059 RepID=UPI0021B4B6A9|nr:endonuclease domain-containing protein [Mycobacterium sp. SMC-4]UXA16953.1 endonuclease domain-containing protein [Mycobacterium sp. SMC-4]
MQVPFIGSEAVAAGVVGKHLLRTRFVALHPDVYTRPGVELNTHHRATAAWLWSRRGGVLAGLTAAALHGARYIEDSQPIELVWSNGRAPRGIRTHKQDLADDEITRRRGLPVTTVQRTAFDLARREGSLDAAVARLDALGNATGFDAADVLLWARQRHAGKRGMRQLAVALDLYDAGAQSPRETWLRLLLIRAGFPRPSTQIPVVSADGRRRYYLDMGWKELKLAVEYDGDQHRVDPLQFAHDIRRAEDLDELDWARVRVVKANSTGDVLARVARVYDARERSARRIPRLRDLSALPATETTRELAG